MTDEITLDEGLVALVAASAEVTAAAGAAQTMWPMLLPDKVATGITYQVVGGSTQATFEDTGLSRLRYQFDCHAQNARTAKAMRMALRRLLNGFQGLLKPGGARVEYIEWIQPIDHFDNEPRLYRCSGEFYVYADFDSDATDSGSPGDGSFVSSVPAVSAPGAGLSLLASVDLNAYTVVAASGGRALIGNPADLTQLGDIAGIASASAQQGTPVAVQFSGPMANPAWSWVLGLPVFFDGSGQLTQTAPIKGFSQAVAIPVSGSSILVEIGDPVVL